MDQVEEYNPPPNPAKTTDSRFREYAARFGRKSWELDALEPQLISTLITDTVFSLRDQNKWDAALDREAAERTALETISENYDDVAAFLEDV